MTSRPPARAAHPATGTRWRARPGFTDPYDGKRACARVHAHGHTFRWCKGDVFVGVQPGTVIDSRRHTIVRDLHAHQNVTVGQVPVIDLIPTQSADWNNPQALRRIADAWATQHIQRARRA